jgi:VanZ family protein
MPVSSSHARTPFRRAGRFVAVLAWAALIYAASGRPNLRVSSDDALDLVLRKAAHVVVFGVLAVLVLRAIRSEQRPRRADLVLAWLVTFAYACSDEWHQSFVDGRVGHPSDVAIDMVGATVALALAARRSPRPEVST